MQRHPPTYTSTSEADPRPVAGSGLAEGDHRSFQVIGVAETPPEEESRGTPEALVVLHSTEDSSEMLIAGTVVQPDGGAGVPAAVAAARWREQWLQMWKRSQLPGKLIRFFGELNRAERVESVYEILARHAASLLGGSAAVVVTPHDGGESASAARDGGESLPEGARLLHPGLMTRSELAREMPTGDPTLAAWAADPLISLIAHVPFGSGGALLVAERRPDRIFDPEDWEILTMLTDQGLCALGRVQLLQTATTLSLTDPLTGLANRRHMDVVLRHAWAAAERGEGLALLMLDLDGFKKVNDSRGHAVGDEILRITADSIRREARGADVVVRYGGDEFLVILPRGTAEGARALASRVRHRLEDWTGVTAGVAVYRSDQASVADLLRAVDEDLYRGKTARRSNARGGGGGDRPEDPMPGVRPRNLPA
jgi:diguanylate cyclase (GGDEF)-like protein